MDGRIGLGKWNTVGHDKAIRSLERAVRYDRVSHAYLITGPRNVGKSTLAIDFARTLNCLGEDPPCGHCIQCERIAACVHADIRIIGVGTDAYDNNHNGVVIGIDQVREIQRESSLKPYEGRTRIFVIEDADRMSEEAANALLKTLEEPPEQVALILLAVEGDLLLPTITSRCRRIDLKLVPKELIVSELSTRYGLDSAYAEEIVRLSGGRPGWAFRTAVDPSVITSLSRSLDAVENVVRGNLEERFRLAEAMAKAFRSDREIVWAELDLWISWWRDVLVVKEGVSLLVVHRSRMHVLEIAAAALSISKVMVVITALQETYALLESNVNPRLALEELMLVIPVLELPAGKSATTEAGVS